MPRNNSRRILRPTLATFGALATFAAGLLAGTVHASMQVDQLTPRPDAHDGLSGRHVTISGDTAAVGVGPSAPGATARAGSLHIYQRTSTSAGERWIHQTELLRGTGRQSYGGRVALDGDTLVVQLAGAATAGSREPLIAIFRGQGGNWTREATIGFTGRLEAIDTHRTVIAAIDNTSPQHELNILIYRNGNWVTDAVIPVGRATSVAIHGGVIVAGSPGGAGDGSAVGAAFVVEQGAGGWQATTVLRPHHDPQDLSDFTDWSFGESVAVTERYIVVGATGRRSSPRIANSKGAVYVFRTAGGAGIRLQPPNARDDSNLGASVAVEDGTMLAGAIGNGTTIPGSVYKFMFYANSGWREVEQLVPAAARAGDAVGTSVAIDGSTAIIGAPGHDDQASNSGAAHVFWLARGSRERLACPGDVDHDGVPDLALLTASGAIVRNLHGELVTTFPVGPPDAPRGLIDVEVMPDINADGVAEIAFLTRFLLRTHVHDPSTAALPLTTAWYHFTRPPVDLEVLADRTGDGVPELAAISGNPPTLRISDGSTGQPLADWSYSPWFYGQDLEVVPDLDGNGFEELAMLGEHNFNDRSDKVEIRNANGAIVQQFWLGSGWQVLEQVIIADINGNGSSEVALRRAEYENRGSTAPERNQIVIRDLVTRQELGVIDEGQPEFPTEQFLAISDINGNGSDELVLFGRREGFGAQKVRVVDSSTGQYLLTTYYEKKAVGLDLQSCADVNGNGAPELVLLGRRASDGHVKAILRDSRTGERLGAVNW